MTAIIDIHAEILDSRGNPTVEVDVLLRSSVSAARRFLGRFHRRARSRRELRDGDGGRCLGGGVTKAVAAVNSEISKR
jgi:enolase